MKDLCYPEGEVGVRERREREKEALRQEILDAARELFVAEGYENVSMRKIADRIEYSPTTIYLYFKDKAQILEEICDETFAKMIAKLEEISTGDDDALAKLRRGMHAYVRFGLAHPHHYILTFLVPLSADDMPEDFSMHGSLGWKAFSMLRSMVQDCIDAGAFKAGDVDVMSQALWTMIHGVTALQITDCVFPWVERDVLIDQVVDAAVEGMRARP